MTTCEKTCVHAAYKIKKAKKKTQTNTHTHTHKKKTKKQKKSSKIVPYAEQLAKEQDASKKKPFIYGKGLYVDTLVNARGYLKERAQIWVDSIDNSLSTVVNCDIKHKTQLLQEISFDLFWYTYFQVL